MRSSRIVLALPLLLAALPTGAAASFNATGWLTGVPLPGILCTNAAGQMYLKGNVHTLRILADDPRVTGSLQAMPNIAWQADGTKIFTGTAYSQVGTWDATGTNFTATGGVWDLLYHGVTQTDGSIHYDISGYGIGGAIDGLRAEIIANRGPGLPFDPTIAYVISGTLKPAPLNTSLLVDNFDDGIISGWLAGGGTRTPALIESGGHFTMDCNWTNISTSDPVNTLAWAGHNAAWSVPDGQTVELRVDLVNLNPAADSAVLAFGVQQGGASYVLMKSHGWVVLVKQNGFAFAALCGDKVTTPDTGVVMSLSLTGVGQNVVLTARIFDKADPRIVLHQLSYEDTPASDAVLSSQEIADLIGGNVPGFGPDPGSALTSGQRAWLGPWQLTDGTKPPAQVTYDNLHLYTYGVPFVGIERAVRLSWPATSMSFSFEGAPTVQGPWLPVHDSVMPGMNQMTVPANGPTRFFRAVQAP